MKGLSVLFQKLFPQLLVIFLLLNLQKAQAQDSYTVSVDNIADRKVRIDAKIFPKGDTLLMSPFGATHLKDGWATFVKNLKVTNTGGEKVEVTKMGNGIFIVARQPTNEQLNLSYEVNIHHDKGEWPFGHKEAAYVNDEMLMATGNSLFITRLDVDSATVSFQLKEPYKVTNAWRQTAANTYVTKGAEELVWTVIAIGKFNVSEIQTGKTKIILAYSDEMSKSKKLIEPTIRNAVKKYESIYGSSPSKQTSAPEKYLYVMNIDTSYVGGGAAFTNSISILFNAIPKRTNKAGTTSWHHILIHEIGHLWNGRLMKTDEQTEWFNEGFTDYLAYKVEYELGLFKKNEWEEMLLKKQLEYSRARDKSKVSLANAGKDKGRNYDIIYSGGLLFADKLNTEIKKATYNKKDISYFLKKMYLAFSTTERPIQIEEIKMTAEQTCSCSLNNLFLEVTDQK